MRPNLRSLVLLVILMQLHLLKGFAQSYTSIYQSNSKESLIPPSPTAASFQKFGVTPVNLNTGVPNISIPVYEVKCGDISVPITLSYHNNGFKPQEKASWVGLGWNLSAGGCITRQQRGSADNTRLTGKNFDDISPLDSATNTQDNKHKQFLKSVYFDQEYDTEPDIFVYNFPGHQGKFMFLKGKPYFGEYEALTVANYNDAFYITDDNGTQYEFSTRETTRRKISTDSRTPQGATSAWFLTSITSADQKHKIVFSYTDHTYHQGQTLTSETYTASYGEALANYSCFTSGAGGVASNFNFTGDNKTNGKTLSQITTSDKQTIKFIQATPYRYDIGNDAPGETAERALQNIVVYGQAGNPDTVISKTAFAYDYFTNSTYPTSGVYARLKLRGLYNLSGTGDTLNNYAFGYENEFDNFPSINTHGTDPWGYYNGDADDQTSLMPQLFFYTEGYNNGGLGPMLKSTYNSPFGKKDPDYNYGKYGVLNKITYPTGGYTTFTYEQNKYAFYNPGGNSLADDQRAVQLKDTAITLTAFNNLSGVTKIDAFFRITTPTMVYVAVSRTIWDSLQLPINTVINPVYIGKLTPVGCEVDDPGNPCDTINVYTAPKFIVNDTMRTDSVLLQAGAYRISLLCDQKSFKTDLGIKYKVPYAQTSASSAASGPGLRIAAINNYDGIRSSPVTQKAYYYEDSLGKPTGVLCESPRYEYLLTSGLKFAAKDASYCGTTPMLQYVFSNDNNAVYNANLNFLFYYNGVKEFTAPQQSNKYYTEHYYQTLVLPAPPTKINYFAAPLMPVHLGVTNVEDILLSSEPVEVKSISWLNKGATYQKQTETNTTYNYVYDKTVTGIRPISNSDENNILATEFTGWTFNENHIFCVWKYPVSTKSVTYDTAGTSSTTTTTFAYNWKRQQSRIEETVNNGKKIITKMKRPADYSGVESGNGILNLAGANVFSPVIETQIWQKNASGDSAMLKGVVTDYDQNYYKPSKKFFLFNTSSLTSLNNETHDEDVGGFNTLLSDTRYAEKMRMNYDKRGNVMEVITDSNRNVPTSYVWGYYGNYPVAKVVGTRYSSITAKIDTAAIQLITDDSLLRVALAPLRTITGAQATIYTYAPYVGATSVTDINGRTTYYEYDNFNRLMNVRDFNKNILKSYVYQYAGLNTLSNSGSNPPSNAIISVTNNTGLNGFTATFTNRTTNAITTFTIPAAGGTLNPALPAGSYNISISKASNSTTFVYSINCSSLSQTAVSASFSNVAVNSNSCNGITIASQGINP